MKRILFSLLTLVFSVCAFAQGWVGDLVETGKDYYIYNVEQKSFLHCGNNWGTRATLDTPGLVFTATASGAGYTLGTTKNGTVNSINLDGRFLGVDGYIDQGSTVWTLTNVGTEKAPVYTMLNAGGKYLYMGDTFSATWCDDNADVTKNAAKWLFVSAERRNSLADFAAVATEEAPIDLTFLVKDAGFINNSGNDRPRHYTWSGGLAYNFDCAEKFRATFDATQTLTDVPNGKYDVEIQGYARLDGGTSVQAELYANEASVKLVNIKDDARTTKMNKGNESGSDAEGYWPNNMEAGHYYFAEGRYNNKVSVYVTDGTLKLGVRNTANNEWVLIDNMRLTYYGENVDLTEYQEALTAKLDEAVALTDPMNKDVKAALDQAINDGQDAEETIVSLTECAAALEVAITNAKASIAEYKKVAQKNAKVATYDAAGQAVYATLLAKYEAREIVLATEADEDFRAATKAQTTPESDFTGAIVNPNFDGNINGWTDTFSGNLNHGFQDNNTYGDINQFMECWAGQWSGAATPYVLPNGKLYQTLTDMPAGQYTLSADIIATQQQVGQSGYIATLDEVTGIYIFAESGAIFKSPACSATGEAPQRMSFTFISTGGNTDVGLLIENTNCNWAAMDNVMLTYNGPVTKNIYQMALEEAIEKVPSTENAVCNAQVLESYNAELTHATTTAETNGLGDDEYKQATTDLNSAISALEASILAYTNTQNAILSCTAKAESNGVKSEFTAAIASIQSAYDGRTMTENQAAEVNAALANILSNLDKSMAHCSQVTAGQDYYIQNVATGMFLGGANDWGTQASLIEHGVPFTPVLVSEGVYHLDSHYYNNGDVSHFLNGTYVDGFATEVTLENLGENVYALKIGGKYLTANTDNTIVANTADAATDKIAQWKFISYTDRLDNMIDEYEDNGTADATWYVKEASISRNLSLSYGNRAWGNGGTYGGENANQCMQIYHAKNEVSQTVAVPNGTYRLTFQGFNRKDAGSQAGATVSANDQTVEMLDITTLGSTPNSMALASTLFTRGEAVNTIDNIQVNDHRLTIRVNSGDANNWTIWDNFVLTLVGDAEFGQTALTQEGYLLVDDSQYVKVGGTENTEAGATTDGSQAVRVVVNTDRAGISTIKLDGAGYLMWNGEKMYTDGTIQEKKITHNSHWTIVDGVAYNIEANGYLGAADGVAKIQSETTPVAIDAVATEEDYADMQGLDLTIPQPGLGLLTGQYAPANNAERLQAIARAATLTGETQLPQTYVLNIIQEIGNVLQDNDWVANLRLTNGLANGDFEGAYEVKDGTGVASDRAIYAPEGWTVEYAGNTNDLTVLDRDNDLAANNVSAITALENGGSHTYMYRGKWGATTNIRIYQNVTLPAGEYVLSCDAWKSGLGGNGLIFVDDQTATLANNQTAWLPLTLSFILEEEKSVRVGFNIIHNSDNSEKLIGFDNFVLVPVLENGDVNADGKVNLTDIDALVDHINEKAETDRPDVNGDGKVSVSDVTKLIDLLQSAAQAQE